MKKQAKTIDHAYHGESAYFPRGAAHSSTHTTQYHNENSRQNHSEEKDKQGNSIDKPMRKEANTVAKTMKKQAKQ